MAADLDPDLTRASYCTRPAAKTRGLSGLRRALRVRHVIVREALAELVGTATLVFVGNSVIANNVNNPVAGAINIPLGYAAALTVALYATGGVSGGHLNPAATLGLCLAGRCNITRLLPFTAAQFIGGFIGAALTHVLFYDLFKTDPERENSDLYRIFATCPTSDISPGGAFFDQVLGTALLLFGILAVTDRRNTNVPRGAAPVAIGVVLYAVIACSSSNTGAALNPARDFGPRLYSYAIGYHQVFWVGGNFWFNPIVGCYVGAVLGTGVYLFFIELHHPPQDDAELPGALDACTAPAERKYACDNAAHVADEACQL